MESPVVLRSVRDGMPRRIRLATVALTVVWLSHA